MTGPWPGTMVRAPSGFRTPSAIYNATTRFHDPTHAAEWRSPEVEAASDDVISLILNGIRAR